MIKGVNHQVVEVTKPTCEYFERVIFFVKPEFSQVSEGTLRERAGKIAGETGADKGEAKQIDSCRKACGVCHCRSYRCTDCQSFYILKKIGLKSNTYFGVLLYFLTDLQKSAMQHFSQAGRLAIHTALPCRTHLWQKSLLSSGGSSSRKASSTL